MMTRLSKTDLYVLRGSLRLAVLFGPLVVGAQIIAWVRDSALDWEAAIGDYSSSAMETDPGLSFVNGASGVWAGDLRITLEDPGTLVWALALAPTLAFGLTVSLVAWWLLGIVRATEVGEPFVETSVRNLRFVSYAIAAAALTIPLATSLVNTVVVDRAIEERGLAFYLDFSTIFVWLLVAAVIHVVAEAFRIGADLRRETEGLI